MPDVRQSTRLKKPVLTPTTTDQNGGDNGEIQEPKKSLSKLPKRKRSEKVDDSPQEKKKTSPYFSKSPIKIESIRKSSLKIERLSSTDSEMKIEEKKNKKKNTLRKEPKSKATLTTEANQKSKVVKKGPTKKPATVTTVEVIDDNDSSMDTENRTAISNESNSTKGQATFSDSDSDSDGGWEDVKSHPVPAELLLANGLNPNDGSHLLSDKHKNGIEIELNEDEISNGKKKKEMTMEQYLQRHLNRVAKARILRFHKLHLVFLLAHGFYIKKLLNLQILKALFYSMLDDEHVRKLSYSPKKTNPNDLHRLLKYFNELFTVDQEIRDENITLHRKSLFTQIISSLKEKSTPSSSIRTFLFIIYARLLNYDVRLAFTADVYRLKPDKQQKLNIPHGSLVKNIKKQQQQNFDVDIEDVTPKKERSLSTKLTNSVSSNKTTRGGRRSCIKKTTYAEERDQDSDIQSVVSLVSTDVPSERLTESEDEEANDFIKRKPINSKSKLTMKKKLSTSCTTDTSRLHSADHSHDLKRVRSTLTIEKNNQAISPDRSSKATKAASRENKRSLYYWCEVYLETNIEYGYVTVDLNTNQINLSEQLEKEVDFPIIYAFSFDMNHFYFKEVTQRYSDSWIDKYRKQHIQHKSIDPKWWAKLGKRFAPKDKKKGKMAKMEDQSIENQLLRKPIPASKASLKGHPLYILQSHLLKFESVYPNETPPVGYLGKDREPIYPRDKVVTLCSKQTWLKEARMVMDNEEPYKIVLGRITNSAKKAGRTERPELQLFGLWQTTTFIPPVAHDGIVPKNEYGNVDLFKPEMIPTGCVHIDLPNIKRICGKLGIDYGEAITGFDAHHGMSIPRKEGVVICREFEHRVHEALEEYEQKQIEKEIKKRDERIYSNWKKLIKAAIIREQLKHKYATTTAPAHGGELATDAKYQWPKVPSQEEDEENEL